MGRIVWLAFGDVEGDVFGNAGAAVEEIRSQTEDVGEDGVEIREMRRPERRVRGAVACNLRRLALKTLRVHEDRNRDHETFDGLDHAEPRLVESG